MVYELTCYQRTGNDEVYIVKHGTSPYMDRKRDVGVRLRAARVGDDVSLSWKTDQIPFAIADVHFGFAIFPLHLDIQTVTVVRP